MRGETRGSFGSERTSPRAPGLVSRWPDLPGGRAYSAESGYGSRYGARPGTVPCRAAKAGGRPGSSPRRWSVKPFVINKHGRLVFPANFLGELDFSVLESLDQFTAV